MATETIAIIEAGGYRSPSGRDVRIGASVTDAVAGTRLYRPDEALPARLPRNSGAPATEVTNETSLSAARRLGPGAACLVFASAKNPGGGFLTGAQAQEESIARSSALYPCQGAAGEFYAFHRRQGDLRYSDRVIYSPRVPVFRADDGALLEEPYTVSFLTAAAPNLGAILTSQPTAAGSVPGVLAARAAASWRWPRRTATASWSWARGAAASSGTTPPSSPRRSPGNSPAPRGTSTMSSSPCSTASAAPRLTPLSPAPCASRHHERRRDPRQQVHPVTTASSISIQRVAAGRPAGPAWGSLQAGAGTARHCQPRRIAPVVAQPGPGR